MHMQRYVYMCEREILHESINTTFLCLMDVWHIFMFPQQIPLSYFLFCQWSSKQQILTIIPQKLLIKTTLFCLLLSSITHWILHHPLFPPAQSLFDSSSAYCNTHRFKCKNYIYKVFVSSIFDTFCNVCLLMLSTVITVLPQSDCC